MPPVSGNQAPQQQTDGAPGSWATVELPARERSPYDSPYARTTYRPTADQLARDAARHRYLRRNVYLPIIIAVALITILFLLVVALAFGIGSPEVLSFIAGMSALIIILFSIPLIILLAILPISWVALRLNRRQQRQMYPETGPMAYRSRVQILLWQLDSLLIGVGNGVESVTGRLRRPLIKLHARAAYWSGWLRGIRGK